MIEEGGPASLFNLGGKIRWQRPPQQRRPFIGRHALVDAIRKPADAGIIVIPDETAVSGIDSRTGQAVWTIASTPDTEFAAPNQNRFAQIQPGGVLRVIDVNTGRVVSQRSVAPEWVSKGATLLEDWLYLSGSDGLRRIPVTGAEPASRVTDDRLGVLRCGMQVCAQGQGFFAILDRRTGKQLWRKEASSFGFIEFSESGTILTIEGTAPKGDHRVILDAEG